MNKHPPHHIPVVQPTSQFQYVQSGGGRGPGCLQPVGERGPGHPTNQRGEVADFWEVAEIGSGLCRDVLETEGASTNSLGAVGMT